MSRSDPFVDHNHRDFEVLRKNRRRNLLWLVLFFGMAIGVLSLIYGILGTDQTKAVRMSREQLSSSGVEWANELLEKELEYRSWLSNHGTDLELRVYESVSDLMLRGALTIAEYQGDTSGEGFLTRTYIALDFAILRISFILLACWRIWFLVVVAVIAWTYLNFRPYAAKDILGQTGNGRFFYSGIRGALENLNAKGVPELQVRGLVCPASADDQETRGSDLGKLLHQAGVDNSTNLALAAILVKHAKYPAFIPRLEDQEKFNVCFDGGELLEASTRFLEKALELHELYSTSDSGTLQDICPERARNGTHLERVNLEHYAHLLKQTFHRSLSAKMRRILGGVNAEILTTVILAYQAGKSIAYESHAGMWVRASAFSQLTARAVLHSVAAFADDYDAETRRTIRGALIYGSRSSVYGPVRFDRNLSEASRSLRQWVEILMACPHELQTVGDEVELFGFISTVHGVWKRVVFEQLENLGEDAKTKIFASQTNLLFLPVEWVVKAMRGLVSRAELDRMAELIQIVSQQQQLRTVAFDSGGEGISAGVPAYEKIFPPLTDQEIDDYAADHQIPSDMVKDWSTFRAVLNAYGWLARRVGDYSVPESSVIFGILRVAEPDSRANDLGLIGLEGVIAMRGTRFEEHWGTHWMQLFQQVRSANMADSKELYRKLMSGIEDKIDDSFDGAAVA